VFDLLSSQSVRMLDEDFIERNPFELVEDPKTILDLGAHVGMFSFAAALKWPKAHVFAVEPHQQNIKNFILGLDMNRDIGNVTLIPVAVGFGDFVDVAMEIGNSGSSSSHPLSFRVFNKDWPMLQSRAMTVRLQDIMRKIGKPIDYLKSDMEGAEFDIFSQLSTPEWAQIRGMWMELHPLSVVKGLDEAKRLFKDYSAFLKDRMGSKPLRIIGPDFSKPIQLEEKVI
jgi:FkbM family methyltransferase